VPSVNHADVGEAMTLIELLTMRKLDTRRKIKLVRHQDDRLNLAAVREAGYLELYQSYQSKPVFDGCDAIVSFLGASGSKATFYGVYEVKAVRRSGEVPLPATCPFPELRPAQGFFYDLGELLGFTDFRDRLVIDWGKGALAWHQWLTDRTVLEYLPVGRISPFPGYLDFVLTYDELCRMVKNESSNRDWHLSLKSVAGVYLITDTIDGRQYVGSATGEEGILGRFRAYAETGHGGNTLLDTLLLEKGKERVKAFQFTVLTTLPRGLSNKRALEQESLYKRKLGTRAFGLNT